MVGQTVSHYKILEKLGEGGMGVVYQAQDTRLDRIVALKFLPSDSTPSDTRKERFLLEAKSAAALNHPNICTIHGLGEHESVQFIEMEYVKGTTLRDKLAAGSLPVPEAIAYAVQICSALEEAHSAGIVHRDIKPENIMVTPKNQIKVMDFGLAKLKGSLRLTRSATTVGTLSYMSPEQIQGTEADARSDIFSAGVLLYEMLTGRSPFRGEHEAAIMYSIVNEDPPPLANFVKDAPGDLQQILIRALQKDRDQRYQTAGEFLADLQGMERGVLQPATRASGTTTISPSQRKSTTNLTISLPDFTWKSFTWVAIFLALIGGGIVAYFSLFPSSADLPRLPIAVADFVNETKEPELDGLSGMLITSLEQSRRLAVLTRGRMFDLLKARGMSDVDRIDESLGRQLCRQAGVGNLVVGVVRKFGKVYSIDLKIVDPEKEAYVLAFKEEGEGIEGIPGMLDRLSEKTRLGFDERTSDVRKASGKVASVTTASLDAYKHFYQGEKLYHQAPWEAALKEFEAAIRIDSAFALAHYWAARIHEGRSRPKEAKAHLTKALALRDRLPERELHLARVLERSMAGDYPGGLEIMKDIEPQYPTDKDLLHQIGIMSLRSRDFLQAEHYLQRVLSMDPTHTQAHIALASAYRAQSNIAKMAEAAKRFVLAVGDGHSYELLAEAYAKLGDYDAGLSTLRQARELFPENPSIVLSIAQLLQFQEKFDEAEKEAQRLLSRAAPKDWAGHGYLVHPWLVAQEIMTANCYYAGKYQRAQGILDNMRRFWLDAKDTSWAMFCQTEKALLLHVGSGDEKRAWQEGMGTLQAGNTKGGGTTPWRIGLALLAGYQGDSSMADRFAGGHKGWTRLVHVLLESRRKNHARAEEIGDSLIIGEINETQLLILFPMATAQFENGNFDGALMSLEKLQRSNLDYFRRRALYYPMTYFLQGKIYEKKNDPKRAVESYEKLLSLWKNADKDIPMFREAQTRLAALRKSERRKT